MGLNRRADGHSAACCSGQTRRVSTGQNSWVSLPSTPANDVDPPVLIHLSSSCRLPLQLAAAVGAQSRFCGPLMHCCTCLGCPLVHAAPDPSQPPVALVMQAKRLAREAETGAGAPKAVLAGAGPDTVSEPGSDDELLAGSLSASDGGSAREQYEGGLSSDEEGPQAAQGRPEVAHAGMQRRAPPDAAGAGTLSLAEQEALALRLIGGA